ncbi:PepSY domain-containing protein [Paraburkholderia sp.]|uniref:PepSY domain-containing protein n=1 Tax=Paraburkholderia sp. TaxID=1926495 RepID=UPI0025DED913|nr:PepSY domain-containing protein [Paraburkholderia sp.]
MLRRLHSVPGLIAALFFVVITLTGAALSVNPVLERARLTGGPHTPLNVATLADRVSTHVPGVTKIVRRPSGAIIAYHDVDGEQQASVVDPSTGNVVGPWRPSPVVRWLTNLHRKLLLGDGGRLAMGVTAAAMLLVALSGLVLLARRMGGWTHLFGRIRGNTLPRLHNETARVALAGLTLSALTGFVLSLTTFGVIPEGGPTQPQPTQTERIDAARLQPVGQIAALRTLDVAALRQVTLPVQGGPASSIEVKTVDGAGYIDPSSGRWLAWQPADGWQRLHAVVRMLHTGEGLWWFGLLLGASSLCVPLLAVTGVLLWARRRQAMPRLSGASSPRDADTVLLVGSEGNSTWGFAAALHRALTQAGLRVHVAPMNDIASEYRSMRRLVVLTATYGDGDAPASATHFLPKLTQSAAGPGVSFAVLGFGDRQFPHFCGYAAAVQSALAAKGFDALLEPGTVDRQSEPEFRAWCARLGEALGVELDIRYTPSLPRTMPLTLVAREDYDADPQALTSVLRFVRAGRRRTPWIWLAKPGLPKFESGDLVGIVPPGSASPRYYSLASASSDGFVEICVRRHPDGLCSGYLTALKPGQTINAFVRPHPHFRPGVGSAPVILIGAGTGIGPLVGFVRHNSARRPMYLYFGARDAGRGFLYRDELAGLVRDRRLLGLTTAFSRSGRRAYVQDRLIGDARGLRSLVLHGAQIMVCGGRGMAEGVARAWERILDGSGLSVSQLRMQGRYVEDVY